MRLEGKGHRLSESTIMQTEYSERRNKSQKRKLNGARQGEWGGGIMGIKARVVPN